MNKKHQELFDEYIKMETLKGRSKQGLSGIKNRVPRFLAFLEAKGIEPNSIDRKIALEYQGELLESKTKEKKRYCKRTVYSYIVGANSFSSFLVDKGILLTNPFKKLRKPRPEKTLPRNILNETEMAALLERLADFTTGGNLKTKITRYRVHVIAELMYASGLRIDEVAHLKEEDINFRYGTIEVRAGKGGISRVAYLNQYAKDVLKLYVKKMRAEIITEWWDKNLLFGIGYDNLGKVVNKTLETAAEEAGVKKITSHGFRHALGFHLLRAGCNIRHIQSILGHKRLRNTEVYTKVAGEDLKKVLDKYHPRQWRKYWNG